METSFAPAERAPFGDWTRTVAQLADEPLVKVLLDSVEGHLVVLNPQRQVVAANAEFLDLCGFSELPEAGLRLGELVRCVSSGLNEGGCGTSAHCASCGAVLAVLEVLEDRRTSERECHLCFETSSGRQTKEFRVKATPLDVAGQSFVVVVFQDISAEKRRQVLEQVFFHDLKNLLAGLSGYGEPAKLQSGDQVASSIVRLSKLVAAEVEAQALVARAEAGDITPRVEPVDVASVIHDLEDIFREAPCSRNKGWQVTGPRPTLATDRTALVRVLVNMVKNAYEASAPGDVVSLEVRSTAEGTTFAVSNPGALSPEVALRIFERSFSTKAGPGRGLGTYSMRLLTDRVLGGRVDFVSTLAEGTRFTLWLPGPLIET
jgi:signal transduction histidine kinase